MPEQKSYSFKLKRGYAYLNFICSPHGEHHEMWMVSRSTHKRKDYFKSLRAAQLFIEINFSASNVQNTSKTGGEQ